MFLENLEHRLLLAASPNVEPRDFPFTLSGSYNGKNPGTYISLPSKTVRPYLDTFDGFLSGGGVVEYADNVSGAGSVSLAHSPGDGHDNFWKHYEYDVVGTLRVQDAGGSLTGGPGPGTKRILDEDSIELFDPPTKGTQIKALNPGALPTDLFGSWSPSDYRVTLSGAGPFLFNGTVTPTITGPTDINVAKVIAAQDCIEIEVIVTGAFPKADHTTEVGKVDAEWLSASGKVVGKLFSEPVYWNTGKITLDDLANIPEGATQLRVTASIAGDSNPTNNEVTVDYQPNLMVTDFGFNISDGVSGHYRIDGASLKSPTTIGLFWSSDGKYSPDDSLAFQFPTSTAANGAGETYEFPAIHGDQIAPPTETQSNLIAVIDPNNDIKECEEGDNERSDHLFVRLWTDISAKQEQVLRGESYLVNYVVRNDSPVQLNVDIKRTWTTNVLMLNQPEFLQETVLLKPGESAKWTDNHAYSHNWEWVAKEPPIYSPPAWQQIVISILQDGSSLWPPGKIINTIYDILNYVVVTRDAILSIPGHPRAGIEHFLVADPVVADAEEVTKKDALEAYVGEDKERSLDTYKETALNSAAALLGINFGVSVGGSTISTLGGYLADWLSTLSGNWRAVYDPPDPAFTVFAGVESPQEDFSDIPVGARRHEALQHALGLAVQSAIFRAIDKKDGANTAGDQTWLAQQLVDLALLLNQQVFDRVQSSNYTAFLAPWTASQLASPEDLVEYWQTHEFSSEVIASLEENGAPAGFADELLAIVRGLTAEDFSKLSADLESQQLRYEAVVSAGQAIAFLKTAIERRVNALGLPVQPISAADQQLLEGYRTFVNARQAADGYGGEFLDKVSAYAADAQRIALQTNNYSALEADLNLAYSAGANAAGRATSIANVKAIVAGLNLPDEISASLKSQVNVQIASVETAISTGKWTDTGSELSALRSLLSSASAADLSEPARQLLVDYVDSMIDIDGSTPSFKSPELAGIPSQITLNAPVSSVLGSALTISNAGLATFVGGRVTLTLSNPRADSHWIFNDSVAFPLVAGDELSLEGVSVARVISAQPDVLEIDLLADATAARVQQLLRSLQIDLPEADQVWTSDLAVELRNGVGGSRDASLTLTRPSGTPSVPGDHAPTDISLTNSSVLENRLPGTVVGTLLAVDQDPGDSFTFTLEAGEGSADNHRFTIVGNQLRTAERFNFEAQSTYSVRVRVSDRDGQTFSKQLTVSVLDGPDAPHLIQLSASSVAENQPAGTLIGELSASDEDGAEQTFTYSFANTPGSEDNAKFVLSGNSLSTAASFDFESENQYALQIRVTDSTGRSFDQRVYVSVTDINEQPIDIAPSTISFAENLPIGATIAVLDTVDSDFGNFFSYSLVGGAGGDDNSKFSIEHGALKTAANFDFENKSSYSIRVLATDPGGLTVERALALSVTDVNDPPTNVTVSSNSLAAHLPGGTIVGTLAAVDADSGDSFTFEFVEGQGSQDNGRFEIEGNQLKATNAFAFTAGSEYSLRVRATDAAGASVEKQLKIYVSPDPTILETQVVTAGVGVIAAEGNLGIDKHPQSVSDDGRYTVFASQSLDLIPGIQTHGWNQIYLRDNVTGVLTLVSRAALNGNGGNDDSSAAQISADGKTIAFISDATDIVADTTIAATSLYVYDVATGTTTLASHRSDDVLVGVNDVVEVARLALSGTKIVYSTAATDVIAGLTDENFFSDLFLYDIATNTNTLITHTHDDTTVAADGFVYDFVISGNAAKVAFSSESTDLVADLTDENSTADIFLYDIVTNTSVLISHEHNSETTTGSDASYFPSISYDGTRIAYESFASNIIDESEDFQSNIFLYDADLGTNSLVTHRFDSPTSPSDWFPENAQISRDGTTIVYESAATNLIADYTGSATQIYAYSVATGTNTLVSHSTSGPAAGADDNSAGPTVSGDGRFILFISQATDLINGLENPDALLALFAYDVVEGTTTLVTHTPDDPLAVAANGEVDAYAFIGSGSTVVLSSSAALTENILYTNEESHVYHYSIGTDSHEIVTHYPSSTTAWGESKFSDMSADGRYVVFQSDAPNVIAGQVSIPGSVNTFLLDRSSGSVRLVNHITASNSTAMNGDATNARISDDGTKIAYEFFDLDTFQSDVLVYDIATSVNTLISRAAGSSNPANSSSSAPRISDDGTKILFESLATNLVVGVADSLGHGDLFLYDVTTGTISLVTHRFDSLTEPANDASYSGEISGDGNKVIFTSYASDLASDATNDTNESLDVFIYDVATGVISLVSHANTSSTVAGDDQSSLPSISRDGMRVVFESFAMNILPGEFDGSTNVYLYDAATGTNRLINHRFDDPTASTNESASTPRISANGTKVVFEARGATLVEGFIEEFGYRNIYVYDVQTDTNTLVSHIDLHSLAEANYNSSDASISGDGQTIVWMTWADNVLSGVTDWNSGNLDTGGFGDVYLYDVATNRNTLLSHISTSRTDTGNDDSTTGDWEYQGRTLSENGSLAIFDSVATDIVAGDLNGKLDIFAVQIGKLLSPGNVQITGNSVAENQEPGANVGSFQASDPDTSDPVTFSLVQGIGDDDNSSFTLTANGELKTAQRFDHETQSVYRIRVRAKDSTGMWTDEQVTISVTDVNDPPELSSIGNRSVAAGELLTFTVNAVDPDRPANTLTFSLDAGAPEGATIGATSGIFQWTPTESQTGNFSLTVRVTDSGTPGLDDFETITIAVGAPNQDPVLQSIGNKSVNEGELLSFSANASDPDGSNSLLTFSLQAGAPVGADIDVSSGAFTWTPTESQDGQYTVTVRVTDGQGAFSEETISIAVGEVNAPPNLTNPGDKSLTEKTKLTFTLDALDSDIVAGQPDAITFAIESGNVAGMTLDSQSGAFEWTPTEDQDGSHVVVFRAADTHNAVSAHQTVTITVNEINEAPVLADPADVSVDEKAVLNFTLSATDSDRVSGVADTVSYAIVSGSLSGMTLDSQTGAFSWTPTEDQDGSHLVVFRATDNHDAASADQTVTITVNEVNDSPWRNESLPFDTNGDGEVVPLDALRIINQLNNPTILGPGGKLPDTRTDDIPFYDVNGDRFCTSNDVLRVINFLNGQQAEGESILSGDAVRQNFVVDIPRGPTSSASSVRERFSEEQRRAESLTRESRQGTRAEQPAPVRSRHSAHPSRIENSDTDSILDAIAADVADALKTSPEDFWSNLD